MSSNSEGERKTLHCPRFRGTEFRPFWRQFINFAASEGFKEILELDGQRHPNRPDSESTLSANPEEAKLQKLHIKANSTAMNRLYYAFGKNEAALRAIDSTASDQWTSCLAADVVKKLKSRFLRSDQMFALKAE